MCWRRRNLRLRFLSGIFFSLNQQKLLYMLGWSKLNVEGFVGSNWCGCERWTQSGRSRISKSFRQSSTSTSYAGTHNNWTDVMWKKSYQSIFDHFSSTYQGIEAEEILAAPFFRINTSTERWLLPWSYQVKVYWSCCGTSAPGTM